MVGDIGSPCHPCLLYVVAQVRWGPDSPKLAVIMAGTMLHPLCGTYQLSSLSTMVDTDLLYRLFESNIDSSLQGYSLNTPEPCLCRW